MKVQELISELKQCPPETEVLIETVDEYKRSTCCRDLKVHFSVDTVSIMGDV